MENQEGDLSFFCQNQSSFKTRFGILSIYQSHLPKWLEQILVSFEYLQLLSLTILFHPTIADLSSSDPSVFELVAYFFKMANPSYLLSFATSDSVTTSVLAMILGYSLFKFLILGYIIYIALFNKEPNSLLKTIWRWIVKFQGRVACCFITSFWIRIIIQVSEGSFSIQGINDSLLTLFAALLLSIEYIFSFLLETQFCYFMPTPSFLSAKNNEMQMFTLAQKFAIQMAQLFISHSVSASIWICIILNLIFSVIRHYRLFTILPYYNFYALQLQGSLNSIVLSLHFAHFFQRILMSSDYSQEIDFRFLIVLWVLISLLTFKISWAFINQIYIRLSTTPQGIQHTPEFLLHKIFAAEYLFENTHVPTNYSAKSTFKHLVGTTQNLNCQQVFHQKEGGITFESFEENGERRIFINYLEHLIRLFPRNSLLKLIFACRNSKSYAGSIKIISKMSRNLWSSYHMTSVILLHDLQQTFHFNDDSHEQSLNVLQFIYSQLFMNQLNREIIKQINLKKQICNNIIDETSNLEIIYQNAQRIHKSKVLIQKRMDGFLKQLPEHYIYPLAVYAEYSLFLNYSIDDYYKYSDICDRKAQKFAKDFEKDELCSENIYQDTNAFLILSAQKLDQITIVYSTKSLKNICGTDRNNFIRSPITTILPSNLGYDRIFKNILEKGHSENQVINTFLTHQEGYLVEADVLIRIHPYVSQNLYLDMIIRPRPENQDFILLNEKGKIEGASRDITRFPKFSSFVHINQISQELSDLNTALNDGNNLLVDSYNSGSKLIDLPLVSNSSFKCRISNFTFESGSYNLIRLEKMTAYVSQNSSRNFIKDKESSHETEVNQDDFLEHKDILPIESPTLFHRDSTRTKDEELISPTTSVRVLLPAKFKKPETDTFDFPQHVKTVPTHKIPLSAPSYMSSKSSKISSMFKVFETAVTAKSYQRSFHCLCFVFYGVILLTFVCQIILKRVLDNTMDNLVVKTDLLNYAQLRALHTTILHNTALGLILVLQGYISSSNATANILSNIANMTASLDIMAEANRGIINNLYSETEETKQMLFKSDVQVRGNYFDYENSETQSLNSFQHTDLITSTINYLYGLRPVVSPASLQAFQFLRHNLMNDFLAKNEEIIEVFQASVNEQRDSLQFLIKLSAIMLPLLLAGIVLLLSVIIWIQYNKEKIYLLAFLRLDPAKIQVVLDNLKVFQNKLINQDKLQEELVPKLIFRLEQASQGYHRVNNSKVVKKGQTQKRYLGYVLKVLVYIFLLIIIVIVNYALVTRATNQIYKKQRQIQYANEISIVTSVSYIAQTETYVSNNTNYIMRKPPLEIFEKQTKQVRQFQTDLYGEFQIEDGVYDPDVYKILFEGVPCESFSFSSYTFCLTLTKLGESTKMVSTLTIFYNFMNKKILNYPTQNKATFIALLIAGLTDINYLQPGSRISASNAQLINQVIRKKLTTSVDDLSDIGTTILVIFSIALVFVSLLIWLQILTKVREVNNDFKKVLAVLPPNIILSSFLLKSFLNQTSNMTQKL